MGNLSGTVGESTLTVAQMPSHTHTFDKGTYGSISEGRGSPNEGKQTTDATGGSTAHTHDISNGTSGNSSSLPPYYTLSYIIRTI